MERQRDTTNSSKQAIEEELDKLRWTLEMVKEQEQIIMDRMTKQKENVDEQVVE